MSHNCTEAIEHLYQYLDSELDEQTASSLKGHLEDCGSCHGSFDFERRLKKVISMHLEEDMPEKVLESVKSMIRQEQSAL